ncbi:hypothetical protein JYT85_01380 [Desulfocapsa sp. AH-315-G09]|uniref:Uncharacterized protein n=1 Tax=Desulfotalea psychrophila TaxID=84980 RepID=A0ABS3AVN2_9BACT|nr:hypothetical protein [Desulfocapsa sp.]MBN4065279.1 hypothetical protein [Desulfocapsa sp. AH-315-G09]MBN4068858.1 hypothetical protein [Desulfotalea psychrophila]
MSDKTPVITQFSYCDSGNAADILDGTLFVTRFLREVSPAFTDANGNAGLSDDGSTGLHMILCGIENSISLAIERL